jgi:cytochrome P450
MSITMPDAMDTAALAPSAGPASAPPRPPLAGLVDTRTLKGDAARKARKHRVFGQIPERAYDDLVFMLRTIGGSALVVSDPVGVKRVLIDNVANYPKTEMEQRFFRALFGAGLLGTDGDVWRRHRRIMAPAFDPRSVASYGPAITRACEAFCGHWDTLAPGAQVDIGSEMSRLTLRIIGGTMFSADSDDVIDVVSDTMKNGFDIGSEFNILDVLPIVSGIRMRRREKRMATQFSPLDAAINRMIDAREKDPGGAQADLLGRLINAHDESGDVALTAREIRDQIVTIFIAGHETTAQAMTWTWYLLSQHPREEARLHAELDAVLGGRTPTQEDLPKLAYARRVVEESMRVYPTAPGLSSRIAMADDEICGVKVRKGTQIAVSPWFMHHHRKLWDDPDRFDPDRFLPERSAGRPRLAYMPFGAGPRVCIGQVLAMNEATLILASLAQRYRLRLAPDQDITPVANVTLRPKAPMKMLLEPR